MSTKNIKLLLEYDGTRYRGWKAGKKDELVTISGKLGEVIRRMTEEEVSLYCGEKTEAGVHAKSQVVQFKTSSLMSSKEMQEYLNHYLPLDISVLSVEEAEERFHAELNPHQITYEYHILVGEVEDVFQRKYVDFRTMAPNIEKMKEVADVLVGRHDFQAFSAGRTKKSTIRDVSEILIHQEKNSIFIRISANGFLKQMPQKMISALIKTGYGEYGKEIILKVLDGSGVIENICEDKALFLTEIRYDGFVK